MEKTLPISRAELKVLQQIALHKTSLQIADELGLKEKTIENHRYNIAKKLNITGNNCVLRYALEHKDELLKID